MKYSTAREGRKEGEGRKKQRENKKKGKEKYGMRKGERQGTWAEGMEGRVLERKQRSSDNTVLESFVETQLS